MGSGSAGLVSLQQRERGAGTEAGEAVFSFSHGEGNEVEPRATGTGCRVPFLPQEEVEGAAFHLLAPPPPPLRAGP